MADLATVTFSGSPAETIENAKAFWKCIDPPPEQKSTLVVSGINHRLKTAPHAGNGKRLAGTYQTHRTSLEMEYDPRCKTHLEDAQKRKEQEQADYMQKIISFREEAQQTLAKRKGERLKKEAISHRQPREFVFNISESSEEDDGALEAMAEIDKFEDNLKQKEIIKPE